MNPTRKPRVKICCIRNLEEAGMAIDAGAAALGLVSKMPSGPGVIPEEVIAHIAARVPPGVATFLLTRSGRSCHHRPAKTHRGELAANRGPQVSYVQFFFLKLERW